MFIISTVLGYIREILFLLSWLVWLFSSLTLASGQTIVVVYSACRITICLGLYLVVISLKRIQLGVQRFVNSFSSPTGPGQLPRLQKAIRHVSSLSEYNRLASELDNLEGLDKWKKDPRSADYDFPTLSLQLSELRRFRAANDVAGLMFSLQNVFHRNYCGLQHSRLYDHSHVGTKSLIEEFYLAVSQDLLFIANQQFPGLSLKAKLRFFQRARKSYGRTALFLSGGGALALYHSGVVRALLKGNCLPSVINGTSGGSIIAAVVATRTLDELRDPKFLNCKLATRYGVKFIPSFRDQIHSFLTKRVLVDHREFIKTAKIYFGPLTTFEEAFKRTGRDVSITVSSHHAANSTVKGSALVLNHITSPHVLIWSAVTTSCALPSLMEPQSLMAKSFDGSIIPYSPISQTFLDGSLHADLPLQRLTELFNVQTAIASQVNPHVAPFLENRSNSHQVPFLNQCEKFLEADMHHRLRRLAKMKVIPKVYGQDLSGVFNGKQRYTGDITVVPHISFRMQFKALSHPSEADMEEFLRGGEVATWPKIAQIQHTLLIEKTLEECIKIVTKQMAAAEKAGGEEVKMREQRRLEGRSESPAERKDRGSGSSAALLGRISTTQLSNHLAEVDSTANSNPLNSTTESTESPESDDRLVNADGSINADQVIGLNSSGDRESEIEGENEGEITLEPSIKSMNFLPADDDDEDSEPHSASFGSVCPDDLDSSKVDSEVDYEDFLDSSQENSPSSNSSSKQKLRSSSLTNLAALATSLFSRASE